MHAEQVVADLSNLGFFRFVPLVHFEEAQHRTVRALTQSGSLDFEFDWDWGVSGRRSWKGGRYFSSDAEGLAELGVADFLWELMPLLNQESVSGQLLADFEQWDAESGRTSYEVLVNADRYQVYEFALDDDVDLWSRSHYRTTEIINALLARAESQERAFGAGSGNDAGIYILTNTLFEYIRDLPLDPVYVPVRGGTG